MTMIGLNKRTVMAIRKIEKIWEYAEAHRRTFAELSDKVWETPEVTYSEHKSAAAHRQAAMVQGFRVTEAIANIPTAFVAEAGSGGPVIAFLGEYDALPGLSQEANIAEPRPLPGNGNGHGCGHNLLGAASLLAATALKDYLAETGLEGTVRYYGCPAEEGGAAKTFMVRAGCFDDVDIAISWHPDSMVRVDPSLSLANTRIDFSFHGRSAHASMAPHLGRSALDAIELMSVGVNYLREHVPSDTRLHYAVLDTGGTAANVVQARAKVRYSVRAIDLVGMQAVLERVIAVAKGAATMTGTRVEAKIISAVANLMANDVLTSRMQDVLDRLGPVQFDESDREYARRIQATLTPEDIEGNYLEVGLPITDKPLCDFVIPIQVRGANMLGSTDVGDVSWVVPTVQARVATHAIGTPGHSWQITAQGKAPAAHKGLLHAAKAMAMMGLEAITDRDLLTAAWNAHRIKVSKVPYTNPIPDEIQPPIAEMSQRV
jgi:amidohydrolase